METAKGSFSLEVMDPDNISGWKDEDPYFGSEKRGKNIILYDWFSMTSKIDSVDSLIASLDFKTPVKWEESYGFYGYKNRVFFDGISGIRQDDDPPESSGKYGRNKGWSDPE